MKKLLVLLMILGVVGCSSKRTEPQPSETQEDAITPEPTDIAQEDFTESKINIDLYKVDEYYPIIDGIVTYPDGTTEEFNHGEYRKDVNGEEQFFLYEQQIVEKIESDAYLTKAELIERGYINYRELVNEVYTVYVDVELHPDYNFVQSSYNNGDVIDGVFGIEYINEKGEKLPFVIYRYSNALPKGEEINESFRVNMAGNIFYTWRIKEYDTLIGFEGYSHEDRSGVIWYGPLEGGVINPHLMTFGLK